MMYPKKPKEKSVADIAPSRSLVGNAVTMPNFVELMEKIEVGSCYEIDRSKLPPRTPALLRHSVRVVMVTAKTELNVTVRYPNTESLEAYFDDRDSVDQDNFFPTMDEKFVMGPELAVKVLVWRISSREFAENRHCKAFWLEQCLGAENFSMPVSMCNSVEDVDSKIGTCLFELQASGFKGWGIRRLVAYVPNDAENEHQYSNHSALSKGEEEEEKQEQQLDGKDEAITGSGKRKRQRTVHRKTKPSKRHNGQKTTLTMCKQKGNYIDRWPVERYERAKLELLEVMKAKGAVYGSAISRSVLRTEARKRIGDTGLLDHLLKHVAGQLAPGGAERFRRRFDSEGTMEYWLESADLVDVRKEYGIDDPYWTPPPGWQPGDSTCVHNSDCATEIRLLREELAKMKTKMQSAASMVQCDKLSTDLPPNSSVCIEPVEMLEIGSSELKALKEMREDLLKRKARTEEQLLEISASLRKVEAQMITQGQQL
ncbi:hypothetical protein Ancab_001723 [Ancistrocladus abbreviatus]